MKKPYIICHMMTSIDGRVGGPKINTAFLEAGLHHDHGVTGRKLMDVRKFDSDAVWLRYQV